METHSHLAQPMITIILPPSLLNAIKLYDCKRDGLSHGFHALSLMKDFLEVDRDRIAINLLVLGAEFIMVQASIIRLVITKVNNLVVVAYL